MRIFRFWCGLIVAMILAGCATEPDYSMSDRERQINKICKMAYNAGLMAPTHGGGVSESFSNAEKAQAECLMRYQQ